MAKRLDDSKVKNKQRQKNTLYRELQEEIKQLKKRVKDLEVERDILLALHRRDTDWEK